MVLALVAPTFAQDAYPTRTITLIVPFAAGGSTDGIGRIMAEGMRQVLGQTVVVSNISGAGGSIGTAAIVTAAPDGYTIGMGTVSTLVINPATYKHLPFDVLRDLIPIGKIAVVPKIMAINPSVPAADMATFIALARQHPGKLSYASAGVGSVSHLLGEQFKLATGTDIVHVPYRGVSPAVNDVIGGHVDLIYDNLPTALQLVRDGRLRALAISGESRNQALPNVPTFAELHLYDMNWTAFFGLVAPKGTPDSIVGKLNAALVDAMAIPAVRGKLSATQAIVAGSSPEEFRMEIMDKLARMRSTVKKAQIQLD
jgi:tripartite-type tricarboxylate transporter receptor subunit TctC